MSEQPIRDLGDGLVLRRATLADGDPLAAFNREIHGEGAWDEKGLEDWTRDLIEGKARPLQRAIPPSSKIPIRAGSFPSAA